MRKTYLLPHFQAEVLRAIARMSGDDPESAYGAAVHDYLDYDIAPGAVYTTLKRLEEQELVDTGVTAPIRKRGGRSRKYYFLTPKGEDILGKL